MMMNCSLKMPECKCAGSAQVRRFAGSENRNHLQASSKRLKASGDLLKGDGFHAIRPLMMGSRPLDMGSLLFLEMS